MLRKGHPTVITVTHEFGVKTEHEFAKNKDDIEYFLKGIAEGLGKLRGLKEVKGD